MSRHVSDKVGWYGFRTQSGLVIRAERFVTPKLSPGSPSKYQRGDVLIPRRPFDWDYVTCLTRLWIKITMKREVMKLTQNANEFWNGFSVFNRLSILTVFVIWILQYILSDIRIARSRNNNCLWNVKFWMKFYQNVNLLYSSKRTDILSSENFSSWGFSVNPTLRLNINEEFIWNWREITSTMTDNEQQVNKWSSYQKNLWVFISILPVKALIRKTR